MSGEHDRRMMEAFLSPAYAGTGGSIAWAVMRLAQEMGGVSSALCALGTDLASETAGISSALRALGTGNAATEMGGLEFVGVALEKIADAIRASAPAEAMDVIADTIHEAAEALRGIGAAINPTPPEGEQ